MLCVFRREKNHIRSGNPLRVLRYPLNISESCLSYEQFVNLKEIFQTTARLRSKTRALGRAKWRGGSRAPLLELPALHDRQFVTPIIFYRIRMALVLPIRLPPDGGPS